MTVRQWTLVVSSLLVVVVSAGTGCAKKAAQVAPLPPPALHVPVPPPRVLAPVAEPETVTEPADPREEPPKATRPRVPARGPASGEPRSEPAKTEPPAAQPLEPARPAGEAAGPALKSPQTANDAVADRRIRDALLRATRDLDRIDRAGLSPDAREQYDMARRFVDQASEALKARNYLFAAYLADKAEALARGLSGR